MVRLSGQEGEKLDKVFGEKIGGLDYQIRKGVYAIIFNSAKDKVLAVQNSRGHYFLPGGGIENEESYQECLEREMLEETGYKVFLGSFIGNAKRYFQSTKNEPLLNDGYFYLAELLDKMQEPIEDDHFIKWINIDSVRELLVHEHHYWAVKEGLKG
ncbi:NUDIX domain-containing protein [Bacillus sp. CFBP9009]